MNYLIAAMQHLGIYYTPPHVSKFIEQQGDAWQVVSANPPFGHKRPARLTRRVRGG